ncbi:hypothetical protein DM806_11890 [Sphingobium lactosutens]|uniref:hypothetical protein n=1 Tax=Sphingobium lactosutens TaxID=522773 RepID=UPI0015BEFFCE|nr:hypothetical protein [Sphingobium lactosutens]NWK96350.1 hypothetical protein [Sphingobium lactosutens]
MLRSSSLLILPLVLMAGSGSASAQMADVPAAICDAPAELPAALASWRQATPLQAVGARKALASATVTPGQTVAMALLPTPKVAYPLRPEKPGGSVSFGGLARFTVDRAGTWRVALSTPAWVDVVKDGKASTSIAHGHGPDCSGIRKMVDYALEPGDYVLQVAANGSDKVTLLVTPLP